MAYNNASSAVIGGSGQVFTAASGTALPSTLATPAATYTGHGYLTEEGVTTTYTPNIQEHSVWQSLQPIRRETLAREILVAFTQAQFDDVTLPFALGGGSITGSNPYTFALPSDTAALEERAMVVDILDGTENHRLTLGRGNVTEPVETQFSRASLAGLPIGFKVLAPTAGGSPGAYITDSTAFAAGS